MEATKNFLCKLAACLIVILAAEASVGHARKTHYIHWNKANPMFRLDNTDHVVGVNVGNLPWEYDQVNIICPVSKPDVKLPERHVIYSVSREEFDSCRITNPKPKIVAVCSKPHQLLQTKEETTVPPWHTSENEGSNACLCWKSL